MLASDAGARIGRIVADRFQATLHDGDRVPRAGPALLVGNHALFGLDSIVLMGLLVSETGRYPRFLAERNLFRVPGLGAALDAAGAIEGTPDAAVRLLEDGELVCVYPGGVDDSFKTSAEAYTLKWGARAGFARVALRARAPVVPVAATGIDDLFDVPEREGLLGRLLLGSSRYDLPLPSSLIPRRVPLDYHVLPPIDPGEGSAADAADPGAVERVRRAAWDAIEGVLAGHRAPRARG
ncbi:MAG: acyltransferase family protein [Polyangiaceae bacterium]|nr:acyltransferase family protein [Polyangiaceae bacterium]